MAIALSFKNHPLRSHGSFSSVARPCFLQYPGYFERRPLFRPIIQRRGYPIGYCGTVKNLPLVVCGGDDEDANKANTARDQIPGEDDNDEKETQANQENAAGEDLQCITSRTDMSEQNWQQYAGTWDRQQPRYNQFRAYEVQRKSERLQEIKPPTTEKPVAAVGSRLQRTCFKDPLTGQEVRLLYPSYEYRRQEFAHKGPLSSTITTTPPFNPHNKIEKLSLDGKKLLWKRQNHIIKLVKMKKIHK